MKDLKGRADEIALEALKQYIANRARAAELAEKLDPNSGLARNARELLQKAQSDYEDFVARIAATDLAQDGAPLPTAAPVQAVAATSTLRASILPAVASVPPALPAAPPASQADLTNGQPSPVQAPPAMTNRAEVPPRKTPVLERSSIEPAALPAGATTSEPAGAEDPSAERNVARALATLGTVFRDRRSPAPEARRDEQSAPPPPASDPPRDRQQIDGKAASPLEQMPLREGAAVSKAQTENSRPTGQHEGISPRIEEQPPGRTTTSSLPVSDKLRDSRPTFGAVPTQPDEVVAARASADVPALRRGESGTVEKHELPPPPTKRAEIPSTKTSVPERSAIEPAALPAVASTAEPVALEDSSAESDVARALATLKTVFRDRLSSAPEAGRDEQAATPAPASDPPRDLIVEKVTSPLEQMPPGEGAVVSEELTEESRTTRHHEGIPLGFEEQPPVQAKTSSSPVGDTLRNSRTMFDVIATPPDREAAARTGADRPAERREVSGTVEEHDAPPPMTNRAELRPAKTSVPERSAIESAALLAIARAAEPAAPEDSSAEMDLARAIATLNIVFQDRLSPAPGARRNEQAATPQPTVTDTLRESRPMFGAIAAALDEEVAGRADAEAERRKVSGTVGEYDDATALFEQHRLAADDSAFDAAYSADQAVVPAEQQLRDIDARSEQEPAAVAKAVLLPEPEIIREPEDTALSTDHVLRQKEEGSSITDAGRQPGATHFDELWDRGFTNPRVFDTEEEAVNAPAAEDAYFDSLDQGEGEEPATTHPGVAPDQPVSVSKKLLDDLALLEARQEAPAISEKPEAEEQPLTSDPALDGFESWLKKWRAGQAT